MDSYNTAEHDNIDFEISLYFYREKLCKVEKYIEVAKIHQKERLMITTYYILAVGVTWILTLFVPSNTTSIAAFAESSTIVSLFFIGSLITWKYSTEGRQDTTYKKKYICVALCYITAIGVCGYLAVKLPPDTAVMMAFTAPSILVFLCSLPKLVDWVAEIVIINMSYDLLP
ncbi:hypothetical protein GCK72_017685 [Caenorhabditis remanei]|nr:hypothetical protein GCK72_017685 [Caenorhabditis remanei]KAF1751131.1 hypothetical protein GCK72_017685 [Caenorhabditis remanei]